MALQKVGTEVGLATMNPTISVIIPTFEDWDGLNNCLEALALQDLDESDYEIIVADNNREQRLPENLALTRNTRVVWEPKPGSYAARNTAIKEARGEFIFFTDSDCLPSKSWLSAGLARFLKEQGCERVAGKIDVVPLKSKWNGWSVYDRVSNLRQDEYVARGHAATANLAVRKSVFGRVGLFREDRFSGGDLEWNRRATVENVPIVFEDAMTVRHPARETHSDCAGKVRRIAGARFAAKSNRPLLKRMPRLKYLLPSIRNFVKIWGDDQNVPAFVRLRAMLCDYQMGWVYNAEIIRLGFLGKAPSRR
ncbi:glycosyltransferase [Sinirhodobacter sp. WL0062]|uniref:Glycosyltransferase n=1 Tax=Rhodobacter flavimaris TaxID=2907145 RepID=A0ABS8Z3A9_9RHOB|nr:glycosyltransferase [Sinirhodobacter sp. WL0062]MCE5975229.1 glycosyltransferase [Sinirhodobacter sp. WL0062]